MFAGVLIGDDQGGSISIRPAEKSDVAAVLEWLREQGVGEQVHGNRVELGAFTDPPARWYVVRLDTLPAIEAQV